MVSEVHVLEFHFAADAEVLDVLDQGVELLVRPLEMERPVHVPERGVRRER